MILEANLPRWTQLEYALQMRPTLTLVGLGFNEVLEAAVTADLRKLPDPGQFGANLDDIVSQLRAVYSEVVVCTVPDPGSTAYLATLDQAEAFLRVPTGTLAAFYGLPSDALLTVPGLVEVGQQLISQQIEPLPNGAFLPGDLAASVSTAVDQMNEQVRSLAGRHGAIVYDLHGIYQQAHDSGWAVSGHTVGGGYLGGFFLLNGYFPGLTGHALIANGLIDLLNREYGTHFPEVDVGAVLATDPTADFRVGERGTTRSRTCSDLHRVMPSPGSGRL